MLESHINTTDLYNVEPELEEYLRSGQTNYSSIISQALRRLDMMMKNRGLELKWLCTRLSLTDGAKSDLDTTERTRLVITPTAVTGTATAVLSGTNDQSNESYTTIATYQNDTETAVSFTSATQKTYEFSQTFNYYKLDFTGTITSTQYLIERSFELPHLYLALSMAYKSLDPNDAFDFKANMYQDMFNTAFAEMQYSYDSNEDGEVDTDELKINRVVFRR